MKKLIKYWKRWQNLSQNEKLTFLRASICLILIKIGLSVLPFSTFRKLFHWLTKYDSVTETSQKYIQETVWAVDSAADHLPIELLCLPRALAAKYLLRRVPALTLEIGIEINPSKSFEAHAWVEKNGSVIIGDWSGSVSYQRLWVWK